VAACAAGCRQIIPVHSTAEALERARQFPAGQALVAGERDGEPIPGFDLGNSPLEYTADRVGGRTIIITTTNGTAAMLAAARASTAAVAAMTNVTAAARWALAQDRDFTVLCSGEKGGFSLEDAVCAGLLVERLIESGADVDPSDAALAACRLGEHYGPRLERLMHDARWARKLTRIGREADLEACLALSTVDQVPLIEQGIVVPGAPVSHALRERA
jgi:2-phosphosulfolactate phosphatase